MRKKLFPYPGSKTLVIDKLIQLFPNNYQDKCWVEAFGGSGILTYYKKESKVEVFNDLDEGISAIFYCLLFKYEELAWRLLNDQHSEIILKWTKTDWHNNHQDVVDKAITKLYQLVYSFGSKNSSVSFWRDPQHFKQRKHTSMRLFDLTVWKQWQQRYKNVQIMGRSAKEVIETFDSKDMFVYCDPPYVISAKGKHYGLNFTHEDHLELHETLKNIDGLFLLSYDKDPLVEDLYANYEMMEIEIPYSIAAKQRTRKKELLIANYPLKKQSKLSDFGVQ